MEDDLECVDVCSKRNITKYKKVEQCTPKIERSCKLLPKRKLSTIELDAIVDEFGHILESIKPIYHKVAHPKMACFKVPTKSCKTHSVPYHVEITDCDQIVQSCEIVQKQTMKKVMVHQCDDKCQIMKIEPPKDCKVECKMIQVPFTVQEAYCSWEHKCQNVPVATDQSNQDLEIFDMLY